MLLFVTEINIRSKVTKCHVYCLEFKQLEWPPVVMTVTWCLLASFTHLHQQIIKTLLCVT